MAVDQTLAQASNLLVYSSMAVYAGALIAFATDLSALGRAAGRAEDERAEDLRAEDERTAQPRRVAVAAGAASTVDVPAPGGATVAGAGAGADAESSVARVRRPAAGIGVSLTWLAFALHLGAVLARGLSAHRVPWSNMYEFSVAGAVVVTGVFLVLLLQRDLRYLGTFVVGPVLLMLGLSVTLLYTESAQLVPALQSYWLVIHVSVAFIASALLTISFSATVLQLVQQRREQLRAAGRQVRGGRFMDGLPRSAELDRASYRMIAVAFPLWTFTLVAGSIWAEKAWGRYWGWDPKEVWTFVIWTVYAAYLHARSTRGWDGRRSAYLAIAGFVCLLINFGVVNVFFTGHHSYAGIG